ncbi:MAG TPA: MauE/DoxX family redox-associated membrane protein [Acidimicrobiales bacterium]|nr:MauE/DoxX family redox-associated membrane protein [Acidimicrobiales bacterium]
MVLGAALVAALVLAGAGALKVVDPAPTAGALRALGVPAPGWVVRVGAAAELVLGVLAVVVGGAVVWVLVALSYLAFAGFVVAALRAGTMVGSCGCFGRVDTPPHPLHVVVDLALAAAAGGAAVQGLVPLDELADAPGQGLVIAALSVLGAVAVYVAFVGLPRALSH